MAVQPRKNFSKRTRPTFGEAALGLKGKTSASAQDWFTNQAARMGFGTPSLAEGAGYELVRFSYNYWELITLFRNHWISRRIVETPAVDMVRAWPKLTSDIDTEDLTKIDRAVRRTGTKNQIQTALTWARLFGGAGALIVIDGQEDSLDEPLDLKSIPIGGYKGLCPFDRWAGIQPEGEICTDPNRPLDFNKPEHYTVSPTGGSSFKVHSSRILRFLGPEVPTPEREAQTWWGISVLEPIYEDIRKYDNMSWNILSLTFRANILGMKFPDLASLLSGLGSSQKATQGFQTRMSAVNHLISNQSLVPLPENGSIESTQYTFGGLADILQLFQLALSGGSQIPVTRLWGRTYSGLGAAREQDEMLYEEKIASDQANGLVPQLEKLYPVLCMSELGEVPDDLDLNCPSIRVLDEKEKGELAKNVVDTSVVLLNSGIMPPKIVAQEIKQASDLTGFGTNLTDEFIETLSDKVQSEGEMGEGLFGEQEGEPNLTPSASPQKVLREVGKEKKQESEEEPGAKGKAKAADADGAGPEVKVHGLTAVIETPCGYSRHGKDASGKPWRQTMPYHYGYFKGIEGADGDSLDVALGDDQSADWVYVFDQKHLPPKKGFDESKVFAHFASQGDALRAFKAGHHRAEDVFMDFTPMQAADFRAWLASANLKRPCSTGHGTLPVTDAVEFKEADHPRQPDGKFGAKGVASMPKGMEHITKGAHKTVASFCTALLASKSPQTGKPYGDQQIASAAQHLFGGKTSAASVAWYKAQAKKKTPEGVKQEAAKQTGIKANDALIAKAKTNPPPMAAVDKVLTHAEKAGYKTVFVAGTKDGKKAFYKVSGVPDGLDSHEYMSQALKKHGVSVSLVSSFNASKPAPPDLNETALTDFEVAEYKQQALKKAAAEVAAKAPFTELEEALSPDTLKAIEHYTNGSYSSLNSNLRNGRPMDASQAALAAHLDKAVAKSRMADDAVVYRGCKLPQKFFGPSITIGSVIIDNGFVSTSKKESTASSFGSGGMTAKIHVKKGARALDVQKMSLHSSEAEVILPRGSMFKIKAVNGKEVELEYVS